MAMFSENEKQSRVELGSPTPNLVDCQKRGGVRECLSPSSQSRPMAGDQGQHRFTRCKRGASLVAESQVISAASATRHRRCAAWLGDGGSSIWRFFELRSEEIPARMQAKARNDLARMFAEELGKAGLETGAIDVFSTPRRLALVARDVAGETAAAREEIKGPKASAPAQALEGFLRKTGLARAQLEERDGVLFAVIDRAGRTAAAVIGHAVGRILADFHGPGDALGRRNGALGAAAARHRRLLGEGSCRPLRGISRARLPRPPLSSSGRDHQRRGE